MNFAVKFSGVTGNVPESLAHKPSHRRFRTWTTRKYSSALFMSVTQQLNMAALSLYNIVLCMLPQKACRLYECNSPDYC